MRRLLSRLFPGLPSATPSAAPGRPAGGLGPPAPLRTPGAPPLALGDRREAFTGTGDWWDLRRELTVALDREFGLVALASQEVTGPTDARVEALAERTDRLLLGCTTGWSYGPLDLDTLHHKVPASHYSRVGEVMVQMYAPLVLKRIEALLSGFSSPSSPGVNGPSPRSSPTPT